MNWTASHIAGSSGPAIFREDGEKNVRLFNAVEATEEELILAAAAPELWDALKEVVDTFDLQDEITPDEHDALEAARALLARCQEGEKP